MMEIRAFLQMLFRRGFLQEIDLEFAFRAACWAGAPDDAALMLLAGLVSGACFRDNETALPVARIGRRADLAEYLGVEADDLPVAGEEWMPVPARYPGIFSDGETAAPLVQSCGLLYLGRNFQEEIFLRDFLKKRLAAAPEAPPGPAAASDSAAVTALAMNAEQRRAVNLARRSRLMVVSGGPGTGKTTIVAAILAARADVAEKIVLCAPTGKAQLRMKQSLHRQIRMLQISPERLRELGATPSGTIHRLLRPEPAGGFRYNRRNRLDCSLLIVDECSMIPLSLMVRLLEAVPDEAAVILLGDRYQLASVEPGAVFGDFCDILRAYPEHFAELSASFRFPEGEGICLLKNAVNESRGAEAWELLRSGRSPQVRAVPLPDAAGGLRTMLCEEFAGTWLCDGAAYHAAESLERAWESFERFRILTPVNAGLHGTLKLNELAGRILGFSGEKPRQAGETVLILTNDYRLGLFNGDTGMFWYADGEGRPLGRREAERSGKKRLLVFFPESGDDGETVWRGFAPERLPEHAPAYALTVHKSQGSDYERVLLLLPETRSGEGRTFLTREILYTGITRAKSHVTVASSQEVFLAVAARATERVSGLRRLYFASGDEAEKRRGQAGASDGEKQGENRR